MTLSFSGKLTVSPFKGQVFLCDTRFPVIATEDDFAGYAEMSRATWAPVLMSFPQKSLFLSRILSSVDATVGPHLDRIVMNCRVPGRRLPVESMDEKLFLVVDLEPEINELVKTDDSVLAIYEGLVRFPLEEGDNDIVVTWHNCRGPDPEGDFAALSDALIKLGFVPVDQ
jgi:hypothetical protein